MFFLVTLSISVILFSIYYIYNNQFDITSTNITCNSSISSELIGQINRITDGDEKIAYLTFDDGPTTSVTPKIGYS